MRIVLACLPREMPLLLGFEVGGEGALVVAGGTVVVVLSVCRSWR